ncbi:MAG: hypothetical protein KDC28_10325 [Saprospiraceae bacterium]|nr:hypothetical protein [Saprospiraceae bacterium]MCB9317824.1 hypothetical protein [Lewinellaceae bacterium]
MNITNRQEKLIDYLYDELSKEERAAFEKELEADPTLRKELQQMQQVRSHLQSVPNLELREPLAMPTATPPQESHRLRWLKPFYGVAASIAALLLLGAWTGLHVEAGKGELVLAFGKNAVRSQAIQDPESITPEIQKYLDRYLQANTVQVNSLVTTAETKMQDWLSQQQNSFEQVVSDKYLVQSKPMSSGTYVTLEGLHSLMQKQNKEIEAKLDFFAENFFQYLQATQQQNQQLLQAGLRELAKTMQEQNLLDPRYSNQTQQVNQNYE